MGWLEKLGLAQKKARPVGQSLEKKRGDSSSTDKQNLFVKGGIFLTLLVITLAAFPLATVYDYSVQVGDQWRRETLRAPFDFAIYKNPDSLRAEREAVRRNVPPYFREVPQAQQKMEAKYDTVTQQMDRLYEVYSSYLQSLEQDSLQNGQTDSTRFVQLRRRARLKLTPQQWRLLKSSYRDYFQSGEQNLRLDKRLLEAVWRIGRQTLEVGLLNVPLDSIRTEEVIVRNEEERTDRRQSKETIYGINEVYDFIENEFQERYQEQPEQAELARAFFRAIFQPSLEYMRSETMQNWQEKTSRISPTRGKVREDDVLVRQGEQVTPAIKRQLSSLERAKQARGGSTLLWERKLGQLMLVLATYIIFFLYLFLLRRPIFNDNSKVFLIALLFAGIVALFGFAIRLPIVAMFAVPVALASLLITVMFDSRVGVFGTMTLALVGALLLGYDFEFFLATFFAGVLGVFSVRDIKNRGQVFISAGPVFMGYLTVLTATWLYLGTDTASYVDDVILVAINAFLLIMTYPLLWVFERSFGITTDLTLLELSDTNRPLLKELSLRAPGTFNHSLQVANLAEAAADAIGANALQVRVGALYHDIGKMLKPEYFVENQRQGDNPHDELKPRMSALIIASHVKEGLEMGRQYNLPRRVLDFIPTHHGTSRIEYFYQKALEQKDPDDPDVLESEFRYPGPRPFSKETGILMLADSVEAASRSLEDPTHKRLKNLIDSIFEARIADGQLDQTEVTFRDLTRIKETYLSLLLGIYHVRVKYPGQGEGEDEQAQAESKSGEKAANQDRAKNEKVPEESPQSLSLKEGDVVGIPEQSVPADESKLEEEEEVEDTSSNGHSSSEVEVAERANDQKDA